MKRKLRILFIVLCMLFFMLYILRPKNYQTNYTITTKNQKFHVKESYQKEQYLLEVDHTFFVTVSSKKKKHNLIEAIYYYENDQYQCMYLVGKNLPNIDLLCHHKDTLYPYQAIKGNDSEIDAFVKSLEQYGYHQEQFEDQQKVVKTSNGITIYNNSVSNHIIGLETYKGIITINQKNVLKEKNIFKNDQYQKEIEQFNQSYYVVADYNQSYEFHEFYVINIETGKESKIVSNQAISLDSYIQGIVDNQIYLFDRNYKKQYKIDIKKRKVQQVGDTDSGVQVYLNGWKNITMYQALKEEIYFIQSPLEESILKQYDYCDSTELYTYCYQKIDTQYQVYRYDNQMPKVRYYITSIPDWKQVAYIEDYFYWKENDKIYYYQDNIGIRVKLSNSEFTFNSKLKFGVYAK